MSDIEHELMHRCGLGDFAAFDELVRLWEQPVGRLLARLVPSTADADDLRQEVFIRVLGARGRYRARGAFSTWIYQITLNVARDAARRRRFRFFSLDNHQPECPADSPGESLCRRELNRKVSQALDALPHRLREVLVCKHFTGLSFAEAARATGLPASTLKSRLASAHKRLRVELSRLGVDSGELEQ